MIITLGPGIRGGHEVWAVWCVNQCPSEGFERDISARPELPEQVGHPSVGQARSDVAERLGGSQAKFLSDEIAQSQADHRVARSEGHRCYIEAQLGAPV